MAKLKLPLIKGKNTSYPKIAKCPWCKKKKVFEPHSFAVLNGGALLIDNGKKQSKYSKKLEGFLDLTWHGADSELGGKGEYPDIYTNLGLVKYVIGGQFELYFCSTKCLRAFLNECVNVLERKMNIKKRRLTSRSS